MFVLDAKEFQTWRSQFVTSKEDRKGLRYAPNTREREISDSDIFLLIFPLIACSVCHPALSLLHVFPLSCWSLILVLDEGKGLSTAQQQYDTTSTINEHIPDFIVLVDDGRGEGDPLHLIVEIKGYRREDAKEKKATMENYCAPGVNNLTQYGRWAFAEFTGATSSRPILETKV